MSDRAAKQARRAKRKAKRTERDAARAETRRYSCVDCGQGPLHGGGGVTVGDRHGTERHYCTTCMTADRLAALMEIRGYSIDRAALAADLAAMDTGGDVATADT